METEKLPEVRLDCFDEKSAQWIVDYVEENVPDRRRGSNAIRREGPTVVITYTDKRWPYDITEMAEAEGLAGDREMGAVYACL